MKKTIASIAMLASTTAVALPVENPKATYKTVCLKVEGKGSHRSVCDATWINSQNGTPLESNGCAKGQIPLVITIVGDASIRSCLPPGVAQL